MNYLNDSKQEQNLLTTSSSIAFYCNDWTIFMDASSIMDTASSLFWMNSVRTLYEKKAKILIPYHCIEEIEQISVNVENKMFSDRAIKRLKHIKELVDIRCVEILGASQNDSEKNVFLSLLQTYGHKNNVLLITQDQKLAGDVFDLAGVLPLALKICTFDMKGQLSELSRENLKKKESVHKVNQTNAEKDSVAAKPSVIMMVDSKALEEKIKAAERRRAAEGFRICTQIIQEADPKIEIHQLSGEGSLVYAGNNPIHLGKEIAVGSRASVFTTSAPLVAKIFHEEAITRHLCDKTKLMLSKPLSFEGICFPAKIIYNKSHEFVGYLMPKAEGYTLQNSVFASKKTFLEFFSRLEAKGSG